MIEYIIPLLSSYLGSGIFDYVHIPIFCLAFLATVPGIIRAFIEMR